MYVHNYTRILINIQNSNKKRSFLYNNEFILIKKPISYDVGFFTKEILY